jgi:hypothetical protein
MHELHASNVPLPGEHPEVLRSPEQPDADGHS